MSHRDYCPDDWTARREGERAFERGEGSWRNPYGESHSSFDTPCEDADAAWRRGYREAERHEEERHAEERRQERRQEEMREQRHYEEQQMYAAADEADMRAEEQRYYDECIEAEHQWHLRRQRWIRRYAHS